VENQLNKLERDSELKGMVLSKMTQKIEEIPEEKIGIDQVRYYTERRKSEIENILERGDLMPPLRHKLTLEYRFLSVRDIYMKIKNRIV
jgi:hypothetical protein